MSSCKVTALYSYPVKSCRGTRVDEARLTPGGLEGDRQLLVVHEGKASSQIRLPRLATVEPRRIDASTIELHLDDGTRLLHEVTDQGALSTVEYYGDTISVIDQGDEIARLLSDAVGKEVRAACLENPFPRSLPLEEFALLDGKDQSRFVDAAPILLTNVASLTDLNSRLDEPVPMDRFRANVVVEGLHAYGEDEVTSLEGDGFRLLRATYCERCAITSTDQKTGERSKEPLATLASYRRRPNGYAGGVLFGAYMAVEGAAKIRVGDELSAT
ncbi:MAG: MOSC N-terminal beta barrel domain-containing protein [Acidobacteriota bacterium]